MKGSGKMFETGEYVVYGRTGICQVTGVTTMRVDGSSGEKLYYVLRPGGETDGKIFTPVEGGKQVLRGIITREEAERLIDEIPSIETLSIENEKFREDSYKKCIRTCECRDLLRIIKTIYVRKQARLSHGKKTTATDERYLKRIISILNFPCYWISPKNIWQIILNSEYTSRRKPKNRYALFDKAERICYGISGNLPEILYL